MAVILLRILQGHMHIGFVYNSGLKVDASHVPKHKFKRSGNVENINLSIIQVGVATHV